MTDESPVRRVPVSVRAVVQRLRRRLRKQGLDLRAGSTRDQRKLGRWYTIDRKRQALADWDLNLEDEARRAGVLAPWEELVIEGKDGAP